MTTKECKKIITDKKQLDKLSEKSFGERYKLMQQRSKQCFKTKL
jgi:hypothetical protein